MSETKYFDSKINSGSYQGLPRDRGNLFILRNLYFFINRLLIFSIEAKPIGIEIKNQWKAQTTNCKDVKKLNDEAGTFVKAKSLVQSYSPPSSKSARILSAWSKGAWILMEVEFDSLLPAVVVLRETLGEWSIVPNAIWSGFTYPWVAAPFIRDYLSRQVPEIPASLLDCFTPQSKSFVSVNRTQTAAEPS